jgi:hypothetical protein
MKYLPIHNKERNPWKKDSPRFPGYRKTATSNFIKSNSSRNPAKSNNNKTRETGLVHGPD